MQIKTNLTALNATNNLSQHSKKAQEALQRLSSGSKLNDLSDDQTLTSLSASLESKITLQTKARENITNGVAMVEIANSAINEQITILDNVKEILLKASNSALYSTEELKDMHTEIVAKLEIFNQIAADTSFNGVHLLQKDSTLAIDDATAGDGANAMSFQTGASSHNIIESTTSINSNIYAIDAVLGLSDNLKLSKLADPSDAIGDTHDFFSNKSIKSFDSGVNPENFISTINLAMEIISGYKKDLSSVSLQLQESFETLNTSISQLQTSNSSLEDIDFAVESANFNKYNILSQTGTFVLAQANQMSEQILTLLE